MFLGVVLVVVLVVRLSVGGLSFQDGTLEGRYATALFMASKDKLDKATGPMGQHITLSIVFLGGCKA